jgi:hypothetical protein
VAARLDLGDGVQVMSGASVLVDLDRLHHAHLLVVHHVAMHHEDAGVVEEARADDGAAAFGRPRHDHGIAPRPIGLRLTANLDHPGTG